MALFGRPSQEDERRAEAYRDWLRRRNPYAIASAVLGVISLIEMGVLIVFGVAGIVLGVVALRQLAKMQSAQTPRGAEGSDDAVPRDRGRGMAWAGIVLSVVSLILAGVIYSLPSA